VSGQSEVAKLLLGKGAIIDAADEDGSTALIAAAENGHIEVIKLLVKNGADEHARSPNGKTAWLIAESKGRIEVLRLLKGLRKDMASRGEMKVNNMEGAD
jgi:ankyrin repeat protein